MLDLMICFQPFPRLVERVKMLKKFSQSLGTENSTYIPFDDSSNLLQDDWLNAEERELKYCAQQRELKIQERFSLDNSSLNNSERGVRSISQELQHKQYNHHKSNSKPHLNQPNNGSKIWRAQTAHTKQMSETQRE